MKIGINAYYYPEPHLGFGRYAHTLIKTLLRIDNEHHYTLFSPRPIDRSELPDDPSRIRVIVLGTRRYEESLRVWETTFAEEEAFKNENVDILFVPYATPPREPNARYKLVVTVHDMHQSLARDVFRLWKHRRALRSLSFLQQRLFADDMRYIRDHAAKILAVSEYAKAETERLWRIEKNRATVVYNSLDPALYKKDYPASYPFPYILYVGGSGGRKNLISLLMAYEFLRHTRRTNAKLVLVGALGASREAKFIARSDFRSDIIMHSYVTDEFLGSLYRYAKTLVFPSLYEGFGLPAIEAMSEGAPVVTFNYSSLPEVTGGFAFYARPTKLGLADAIERAVSLSPAERTLYGARAMEFVKARYNAENNARKALDAFTSL